MRTEAEVKRELETLEKVYSDNLGMVDDEILALIRALQWVLKRKARLMGP